MQRSPLLVVAVGLAALLGAVCYEAYLSTTAILLVMLTSVFITWYNQREPPSDNYAVMITGCDTGLGFSLALHAHHIGLTVIAACLDHGGSGAQKLKELCGAERMHVVHMNVTDEEGVRRAVERVREILRDKPKLKLKALVNNAAVMVFGEFEWQTERQIRHQVEVNILGTMRVTRAFCSTLRKYQGRIIVVSSHCASASLPGLATYGATKGALKNWADSLRVEQAKYGVRVISFVPGSFIDKSNIMAKHTEHAKEMEDGLSTEDKIHFGEYFHRFHSYLSGLSVPDRQPSKMPDAALDDLFERALLSCHPRPHYVHEPWRRANCCNGTSLTEVSSASCSFEAQLNKRKMICLSSSLLFVLAIYLKVTRFAAASPVNSTKDFGLMCYQCASDNRDTTPLCDTTFWKLTTKNEKREMTFKCPSKKAKFCVKKIVRGKFYTHTTRGCNGAIDSVGTQLKEGCTNIRSESDTTVCLCSTDNCNSAQVLTPNKMSIIICPGGILMLMWCWSTI